MTLDSGMPGNPCRLLDSITAGHWPGEHHIKARSDVWLSAVLRSIGDAVIACNADGSVVFMNRVAEVLTGWQESEAQGLPLANIFRIVNETTRQIVESPVDKVRRAGTVVGLANHTMLLRRDGTEISIDDSGAPIFDEQNRLSGIVLIFRDITEKRRAERNLELLAASGDALAASLDVQVTLKRIASLSIKSFCDFCYFDFIDRNGEILRTTRLHRDPARQSLLEHASRWSPDAQNQKHPVRQALSDAKPLLVERVDAAWLAAAALNPEHHAAITELKFHTLLAIPLIADGLMLGSLTFCRTTQPHSFDQEDIQVAAELGRRVSTAIINGRLYRSLAEREASLQLALQAGEIGIWEFHPPTGELIWSPRVREIFGVSRDEKMSIERNLELVHPDDRARTISVMDAALKPGSSGEYTVDFRVVRPSGEIRWVSAQGRAFFENQLNTDAGAQPQLITKLFVGMVLDVTEIRRTEEAIRASEGRFRALIENASVGILIGGLEGEITYVNPALLRRLGYTPQDIAEGKVRWDRLTPEEFAEADQRAIDQLKAFGTCEPYEKAYFDASGQPVPLLLGATLIEDSTGEQREVAVFVTDLSGLRKTEAALRESEKLAAVGRLAGSIAHEINNPLEAVTNLLYLMNAKLPTGELQQLAATAQEELARVSHIVTHTLRFHRQSTKTVKTRISAILDSVLALYRGRLLNAGISVETRFRNARPLLCYDGEIRQVLANFVGNALDATPRGGRILVREREATDFRNSRRGLLVTVADTGAGMTPEVLSNAFKAFFTTKGIGGTGLGLWISEEIIHKHNGKLKVRSRTRASGETEKKCGTVFMLFLPYETQVDTFQPNADSSSLQ